MPMTDEMLKKFSRTIQDSDQTINSTDLQLVFTSQEFKSALKLQPQHSETNRSDIRTDNRY
jgi:hypothetical protein